jgi:NifU-like protein involved in Fe-S cluster formation
MKEVDIIRNFYSQIAAEGFKHEDSVDSPDISLKAVLTKGCHGNSNDLLFLDLKLNEKTIAEIGYNCEYCDMLMYVVGEALCKRLKGASLDEIETLKDKDLFGLIGGESKKALKRWNNALEILRDKFFTVL